MLSDSLLLSAFASDCLVSVSDLMLTSFWYKFLSCVRKLLSSPQILYRVIDFRYCSLLLAYYNEGLSSIDFKSYSKLSKFLFLAESAL